jgi:hypothetical protein
MLAVLRCAVLGLWLVCNDSCCYKSGLAPNMCCLWSFPLPSCFSSWMAFSHCVQKLVYVRKAH